MQRDRARHPIVGVPARDLKPVKAAVFCQEIPLDLDGLAVPLLFRADAQIQGRPSYTVALRAVAVLARHG